MGKQESNYGNTFEEDIEEEYLTPKSSSPFGQEYVDPIVYASPTDSPELRAEAAYIPISPKLQIKEAKPVRKTERNYGSWIPGGGETVRSNSRSADRGTSIIKFLRYGVGTLIILIPVVVIYFAVQYGIDLYRS